MIWETARNVTGIYSWDQREEAPHVSFNLYTRTFLGLDPLCDSVKLCRTSGYFGKVCRRGVLTGVSLSHRRASKAPPNNLILGRALLGQPHLAISEDGGLFGKHTIRKFLRTRKANFFHTSYVVRH